MPGYVITGPDGREYDVDAPEGATEAQILDYVKRNVAMLPAPKQIPATEYGPKQVPYKGSILPVSVDEQGKTSFDMGAGLPGMISRAITAPGEALEGKFDAMSDEGIKRAAETAGLISPISAASRAGEYAGALSPALRQQKPKVPTAESLKEAAKSSYTQARNMGVDYSADAVKSMADDIQRTLEADGIIAELSPKTFAILNKLREPPADSVATLSGLDAARKALGHAAGDFNNRTEQLAAQRVVEALDEFLLGGHSGRPMAGPSAAQGGSAQNRPRIGGPGQNPDPASEAARLLKEARGNYAASMRSDQLTGLGEAAEQRAAAANSGQNIGNAIRQRLASLLQSNKQSRGFSDQEVAAIDRIVRGTPATNSLRYTGNLLGGGGGLGQALTAAGGAALGSAAAGGEGAMLGAAIPAAIGGASRAGANVLTQRQLRLIDEMVRARSPLYQRMQQNAPMVPVTLDLRAAIVRAFLGEQLAAQQVQ